jgi:hypothetical protein
MRGESREKECNLLEKSILIIREDIIYVRCAE